MDSSEESLCLFIKKKKRSPNFSSLEILEIERNPDIHTYMCIAFYKLSDIVTNDKEEGLKDCLWK